MTTVKKVYYIRFVQDMLDMLYEFNSLEACEFL